MISERENDILGILVQDYIESATPVSSRHISRALGHSLSPASIRNTLATLSDQGYIKQPHTSAGLVPTQKAYRFFVDTLLEDADGEYSGGGREALEHLQGGVLSKLGVISGVMAERLTLDAAGFEHLFSEPEFSEHAMIKQFGKFLRTLEKARRDYAEALHENEFAVLIGHENPVHYASNISMAVRLFDDGCIFFVAGPMRMDYEKVINAFRNI